MAIGGGKLAYGVFSGILDLPVFFPVILDLIPMFFRWL